MAAGVRDPVSVLDHLAVAPIARQIFFATAAASRPSTSTRGVHDGQHPFARSPVVEPLPRRRTHPPRLSTRARLLATGRRRAPRAGPPRVPVLPPGGDLPATARPEQADGRGTEGPRPSAGAARRCASPERSRIPGRRSSEPGWPAGWPFPSTRSWWPRKWRRCLHSTSCRFVVALDLLLPLLRSSDTAGPDAVFVTSLKDRLPRWDRLLYTAARFHRLGLRSRQRAAIGHQPGRCAGRGFARYRARRACRRRARRTSCRPAERPGIPRR